MISSCYISHTCAMASTFHKNGKTDIITDYHCRKIILFVEHFALVTKLFCDFFCPFTIVLHVCKSAPLFAS